MGFNTFCWNPLLREAIQEYVLLVVGIQVEEEGGGVGQEEREEGEDLLGGQHMDVEEVAGEGYPP